MNELNLEISNANFDFELYKSDSDIKIEKMKSENIDLVNEIDRLKTDNKVFNYKLLWKCTIMLFDISIFSII